DSELLLCHGTVCVVGRVRDLILQLSKSSIYSTKPSHDGRNEHHDACPHYEPSNRAEIQPAP
ncbi:hypothetical protein BV923_10910, partial [Pectobacterium odoriferum]